SIWASCDLLAPAAVESGIGAFLVAPLVNYVRTPDAHVHNICICTALLRFDQHDFSFGPARYRHYAAKRSLSEIDQCTSETELRGNRFGLVLRTCKGGVATIHDAPVGRVTNSCLCPFNEWGIGFDGGPNRLHHLGRGDF